MISTNCNTLLWISLEGAVTSLGVWLTLFIETILKAAVYITKIRNVLFLGNILLTTYLTSQSSVRCFFTIDKLHTQHLQFLQILFMVRRKWTYINCILKVYNPSPFNLQKCNSVCTCIIIVFLQLISINETHFCRHSNL